MGILTQQPAGQPSGGIIDDATAHAMAEQAWATRRQQLAQQPSIPQQAWDAFMRWRQGNLDQLTAAAHGDPDAIGSVAAGFVGGLKPEGEGITAYHGSPHSFDRFDMSKIGTGEGAQAYGHGLYFADNEAVARSYRNNLSGGQRGSMYQVRVNADPNAMLDWSKPVEQQSPQVQQALQSVPGGWSPGMAPSAETAQALNSAGVPGIKYADAGSQFSVSARPRPGGGPTSYVLKDPAGKTVSTHATMDEAQAAMSKAQTHNYVVFDDKLIDILKKYGLVGGFLGTGAAAMQGNQQ